jgi:hypothetical protein
MLSGWMFVTLALAAEPTVRCALCPDGTTTGFPNEQDCPVKCKSSSDGEAVLRFTAGWVLAWADLDGEIRAPSPQRDVELDMSDVLWIVYEDGKLSTRPEIEAWLAGEAPICVATP